MRFYPLFCQAQNACKIWWGCEPLAEVQQANSLKKLQIDFKISGIPTIWYSDMFFLICIKTLI
ncbi:Hypothetical protein PP7435_CHR1-1598 [Komagataella phaffii CBS 7435]|uniref:Uncharacterized protein n=1 Tax=Komagataella phaffii (strain ATCC 76273 / CBS 7435 / CECT 11047 / NRRL Y-11430 / Wegner 21-1) TaxID=981350 RepID=A0A1G4KNW9_KOMPC|nr:Hypothetical protein BQ9382_C1-0038 [Komagataella phaffii CBS 7435]SCV11750.1 Hypothetical protein PP7435_CHR1-1598 [Komagataella phaffii CBS 7435]